MKRIILIISILVILTSCVKDYDFNPTATIVRQLANFNQK